AGRELEVVALAMLRAELLHLDCQDGAAVEQFDLLILPRLDRVGKAARFVVEQNQVWLKLAQFQQEAAAEFYHLHDRQRTAGFEWGSEREFASAQEALEEGKHHQALAALWRGVVRTYRQGCWQVHDLAVCRLGKEWLRIGEPIEAVYCA